MTTTVRQHSGASARFLSLPIPIELLEDDGTGSVWLKLNEGWVKVTSMKNLWEMDGYQEQEQPVIRMRFRASTEDGRTLLLFQDLLEGQWYREFTLGSADQERPASIYRA